MRNKMRIHEKVFQELLYIFYLRNKHYSKRYKKIWWFQLLVDARECWKYIHEFNINQISALNTQ